MRLSFVIAGLLLLAAQQSRAGEFLAGLEDVPVMPGIEVAREAGVAFDTPAGRIVEAYAAGNVTRDAVRKFYRAALPQLGWVRTGALVFGREGERLTLELIGNAPGIVTVRFELGPTPK
jgi:hypothetical protein